MGKLITMLSVILFIDLLFIITGQSTGTLSSILIDSLLNIGQVNATQFFSQLIGDIAGLGGSGTGILSLLAAGGVIVGSIVTRDFNILFIPMTATLALLVGDLIIIANRLIEINPVWGTVIMAPFIIMYLFVAVEWLRGKD